jgi:hypothetical protein
MQRSFAEISVTLAFVRKKIQTWYTIFDLFAVDATCFGLNENHRGSQRKVYKLLRPFYDKIATANTM